ncbi:MAG: hypothetical protein VB140_01915 [Burkholderia sp.]
MQQRLVSSEMMPVDTIASSRSIYAQSPSSSMIGTAIFRLLFLLRPS